MDFDITYAFSFMRLFMKKREGTAPCVDFNKLQVFIFSLYDVIRIFS